MNFSKRSLMVFGAISVLVLVLLVAMPGLSSVDPRTGERITTPTEALDRVRALGNTHAALGNLPGLLRRWPGDPDLQAAQRLLTAELTRAKPDSPFVERPVRDVLETLGAREEDAAIARATEGFFREVADADGGIDARAAALLGHQHATPPPLLRYVDMANGFGKAGRRRAQVRWLLRGLTHHPRSHELLSALARTYVADSRLPEGFAVTALPIDEDAEGAGEFFGLRAQLAGWLDHPRAEAMARERQIADREDATARRRLIALYDYLGEPERGVEHAVALARASGEISDLEGAIEYSLTAGRPQVAFDLLRELAADAKDAQPWLERIAALAITDLRHVLAIESLERLQSRNSTEAVEKRLAGLYRRHDQPRKLVELLLGRLERKPTDYQLGFRVIGMLVGLGELDRARELDVKLRAAIVDPSGFFAQIAVLYHEHVPGLGAMAMAMASADSFRPKTLGKVLEKLDPLVSHPRFRRVVDHLLDRFPDQRSSREYRLRLLAQLPTTRERVAVLEKLVRRFKDEAAYADTWLQQIGYLDEPEVELRAREYLLRGDPEDVDNREKLARLLEDTNRPDAALPHWRFLAERVNGSIIAKVRYARALFASGESDRAISMLREHARHATASPRENIAAADLLFEMDHFDTAREFYLAYLKIAPDDPHSLLRIGQISSWANDPRGAVPYIRRRLAVSDEDRPRVQYYLAEALWALQEWAEAEALYVAALAAWRSTKEPALDVAKMRARSLFRVGKLDAAELAYVGVLAREPRDVDAHIEIFEMLHQVGRDEAAEEHLHIARRLSPGSARLLRSEAGFLADQHRFAESISTFTKYLDLYGADAGVYAELGNVYEESGADHDAFDAYRRWMALQEGNTTAASRAFLAGDRIADLAGARVHARWVEDDRAVESTLDWSLLFGQRTRVYGSLGHGSYSGRAQAVAAGTQDVKEDTRILDLALSHRFGKRDFVGVGVTWNPDVEGEEAGAWAGLYLQSGDPDFSLEINGHYGRLLTNPVAAAGLEGRSEGVNSRVFVNATERVWASAELDYQRLGIRLPATGTRVEDDYFTGTGSLGYTWIRSRTAVADQFRPRRCPAGPESPYLGGEAVDWQLTTWVAYQAIRLRGDEDLLTQIPIGNRFDYAMVAARVDKQFGRGFGAKLEAYAGADVRSGDSIWGSDLETTWRPSPAFEATLAGGIGDELGRTGSDSTSYHLRLQLAWRF